MKVDDKTAVRVSSNGSGVSPKVADEIDLYDQLVVFVDLLPAEKQRYLDWSDKGASKKRIEVDASEPVETTVSEEVAFETTKPVSKSGPLEGEPKGNPTIDQASAQVADEFGTRSTLAEMNPQYVFTTILPGQACRTCGAQSEADDLFCMSCGAFLNGVGTPAFDPSCGDCRRDINLDEIFCPWCGSTLAAC